MKAKQIDTDFEVLFPDDYMQSITERLTLYKELSELKIDEELLSFENKLKDRFGELPCQVVDLLNTVRIKWLAKNLGLERIVLKQKRMVGYFISDQQSDFYQSDTFRRFLTYVQKNSKMCVMKEKKTQKGLRLLITFIRIGSIEKALKTLSDIQ